MLGNTGEPARDLLCPCTQGTHRLGGSGVKGNRHSITILRQELRERGPVAVGDLALAVEAQSKCLLNRRSLKRR